MLLAATPARAADPPGTPRSREALDLCHRAEAPSAESQSLLSRSLELSEQAIAEDEKDSLGHFAEFCAVGKQAEIAGKSLLGLPKVFRLRRAVDRTLELAPDFADALLGKGALLLHLPRLLGGDPAEGERLVRRALEVDPEYVDAHLELARALAAKGDTTAARAEATSAAGAAERAGRPEKALEARRLASELSP